MKRRISLLLAIFMILSVTLGAVSCNNKDGDQGETSVSTKDPVAGGENDGDDEAYLYDDLPTGDYEGYVFHFLTNEGDPITQMVPTVTSDSISQALFQRNSIVKQRLNVDIKETSMRYDEAQAEMRKLHSTSEKVYDAVFNEVYLQTPLAQDGAYLAIDDYEEYLDLSKPWWFTEAIDSISIDGRSFELFGDFRLTYYDSLWGMTFNQQILQENKQEYPYDLVREGDWTIEALKTLVTNTTPEDGGSAGNYGMVSHKDFITAMVTASDFLVVEQDEEDILVKYENTELLVDIYNQITNAFFLSNGDGAHNWVRGDYKSEKYLSGAFDIEDADGSFQKLFTSGRASFMSGTVTDLRSVRVSEFDYGIVPMPKYDTEQEKYVSHIYRAAASCSIPTTNDNLERTCAVFENLAAYSYKLVKYEYYDIVVQTRTVRDSDSMEMLDVIFGHDELGSTSFQLDTVYNIGIFDCIRKNMSDANTEIASQLQGINSTVRGNIDKVIEGYKG